MPLRNATPLTFRWRTLSDALDSTNVGRGAAASLQNLIPSLHTRGLFVLRPACIQVASFSGRVESAFVSGARIYGMVTSGTFTGHSEPFCWDTSISSLVAISGVTSANTPVSTSASGDWVPPTIAQVGPRFIYTHPGFPGGATKFGWVDASNPASPAWSAGDLATNPLVAVPQAVAEFFGRAYYAVGNALAFSDVGNPLQASGASGVQVLGMGNGLTITALAGLPLATTTGGITQALIAFQGASAIQQITGDPTTSNLAVNQLSNETGTLAPLSIASSPYGLFFLAHDGLRRIDPLGIIQEPIGTDGKGVQSPFVNIVTPTRAAAAYQEDVYRVTIQTAISGTLGSFDYWYHPTIKDQGNPEGTWSGPHTFPYGVIAASATDQSFYLFPPAGTPPGIWQSEVMARANSTYAENGVPLTFIATSCLMPDTGAMAMNFMVESSLLLALPAGNALTVQALDETGVMLAPTVMIQGYGGTGAAIWGQAVWGQARWGTESGALVQRTIPWSQPLVFKQMQMLFAGQSTVPVAIGNLYLRYQRTGYMSSPGL